MIQPLTYQEYLALPDSLVSELMVILEVVPAAIEAKRATTTGS